MPDVSEYEKYFLAELLTNTQSISVLLCENSITIRSHITYFLSSTLLKENFEHNFFSFTLTDRITSLRLDYGTTPYISILFAFLFNFPRLALAEYLARRLWSLKGLEVDHFALNSRNQNKSWIYWKVQFRVYLS